MAKIAEQVSAGDDAEIPDAAAVGNLSAKQLELEYKQLQKNFRRAILCAKKYGWETSKCVSEGRKIQDAIVQKGI